MTTTTPPLSTALLHQVFLHLSQLTLDRPHQLPSDPLLLAFGQHVPQISLAWLTARQQNCALPSEATEPDDVVTAGVVDVTVDANNVTARVDATVTG